ncbi:hypothetical protein BDV25DRAFT_139926 [Aspergillus avenaceus]|uniref:Uncharacterized protein n=1 Tax=Aspergillus avenaceus TaxID=36643 RepID=A0A5N6TVQ1_ASPAV|nr:hypothetical protein BDV25DRAFT_139926 [Aspergillus avenaceus]
MPPLAKYLSRPDSHLSMWMSHHREWDDSRNREKEEALQSYTSGIWELEEEPAQRSNAFCYIGDWGTGCDYYADFASWGDGY